MQTLRSVKAQGDILFRKPVREDGAEIWQLIRACKPLDENSVYCNLLQADHFADTCVVAEMGGAVVGWVSAYTLPNDPETLFVWQVAVGEAARGRGLGGRMLAHLAGRETCEGVTRLQTTITLDNDASWALFRKFARTRGARLDSEAHFTRDMHFLGEHATEHMVTIALPQAMRRAA